MGTLIKVTKLPSNIASPQTISVMIVSHDMRAAPPNKEQRDNPDGSG